MSTSFIRQAIIFILVSALTAPLISADGEIIKKITVEGNVSLRDDAILYYTDFEEGKEYIDEMGRQNFERLWNTGILDYLSIEVEDYENGVHVIIKVEERPVIRHVDFRGGKKITEAKIEEVLKMNQVEFKENAYIDRSAVQRAEDIIEEFLGTKGYKYAEVESDIQYVSRTERSLVFNIDLGDRLKIKKINVEGNERFSDRKIRKTMEKTAEKWMFSWITRHNIFSEQQLGVDLESVIELYKNNGYVEVEIEEPDIEIKEKKEGDPRWVYITLYVKEGREYYIGDLTVEGNEIFEDEKLLSLVNQEKGDLYRENVIRKGIEYIDSLYGNKGYIYAYTALVTDPHPDTGVVDVSLDVQEGKPYYLGRLEFEGNTQTKDAVLRREFRINEGELFNKRLFEGSMIKLNQLGYFEVTEYPRVTPVKDKDEVDVIIKGREAGKNQIEFGGGYSDLEGAFVRAAYSTRNFLGRGEILNFSAQLGGTRDLYSIGFTEPWLFGKPYALGGNIYRSETEYVDFIQKSSGGGIRFGFPLTFFTRASLGYSYDKSDITSEGLYYTGDNAEGDPIYETLRTTRTYTVSQISPVVTFDTTNHPFTPSKGLRLVGSADVAGGVLGGDSSFFKPKFTGSWFHNVYKKSYLGFNAEVGYIKSMGKEGVPISEYYYLGGDSSMRGYESRSIYPSDYDAENDVRIPPLNDDGFYIGGDRYLLFNAELVWPISKQFHIVTFADAGNSYLGSYEPGDLYYSAGLELRFFVPMFQYPLRIIWADAINPEEYHETKNFIFSIGTTF